MRKRKKGDGFLIPTICCGEQHDVFIHNNGQVVFLNHAAGSLRALSVEHSLLSEEEANRKECLKVAAAIRGKAMNGLPTWFIRHLEANQWRKKQERSLRDNSNGHDWMADPFFFRVSVPTVAKALELLDKMPFRTSSKTGHRVEIIPLHYKQSTYVTGASERSKINKTGKRQFNRMRQVVKLYLNTKKWAVAYLRGVGTVGNKFVTEIYKEKSDNELVVGILHQSTGNNVVIQRTVIRRGHDRVWRVHSIE